MTHSASLLLATSWQPLPQTATRIVFQKDKSVRCRSAFWTLSGLHSFGQAEPPAQGTLPFGPKSFTLQSLTQGHPCSRWLQNWSKADVNPGRRGRLGKRWGQPDLGICRRSGPNKPASQSVPAVPSPQALHQRGGSGEGHLWFPAWDHVTPAFEQTCLYFPVTTWIRIVANEANPGCQEPPHSPGPVFRLRPGLGLSPAATQRCATGLWSQGTGSEQPSLLPGPLRPPACLSAHCSLSFLLGVLLPRPHCLILRSKVSLTFCPASPGTSDPSSLFL